MWYLAFPLACLLLHSQAPSFPEVRGSTWRMPRAEECRAIVLVFIGHDCPISNAYTPEILRLHQEFSPKKVAFCLVYTDPELTKEDARQHAQQYSFPCPAILDAKQKLARQYGATIMPEAVVLSSQGQLFYRGRINDLYVDLGKKRSQATTHDLKNALDATLAGKPVPVPRTTAVGCYIHQK
jgi:hypothetical protein